MPVSPALQESYAIFIMLRKTSRRLARFDVTFVLADLREKGLLIVGPGGLEFWCAHLNRQKVGGGSPPRTKK
jgi:hypothetical protein